MPESVGKYDGSSNAIALTDVEPTHPEIVEHFASLILPADIHTNFKVTPLTALSVYRGNRTP